MLHYYHHFFFKLYHCHFSVPPGLLYWYHGSDMLQDSDRLSIVTNFETTVTSQLVVTSARETDSGNYTCWPTKFKPVSTMVHVIPGENICSS